LRLPRVSAKLAKMIDVTNWKVPKWPFFAAYAVMLGFAYFFILRAPQSVHHWELAAGCVALGALLSLIPFYLDYRAMGRALEINALGEVGDKMQNLETLSAQIGSATSHWAIIQETVQTEAGKTTAAAKAIADQMAAEARQFSDFMQKMNDSEKAALRLEAEKLHRAEGEWLQMLVRVFDHVFALHTGAVRTGDPRFIEPITNFQNACRETVRRVGLTPFVAEPDELFDAERHQAAGKPGKISNGAVVAETIGAGYTFQGKLLRPALVRVRDASAPAVKSMEKPVPAARPAIQNTGEELSLESPD